MTTPLKTINTRAAQTKYRLKKLLASGTGTAKEVAHLKSLYEQQRREYLALKRQSQLDDMI
ncbi:MAG: hypothetical protein GC179_08775 [Anaerolineaceae bacterium]|nr:hypothetical protein [Anaerolineaceae bacterium]